MRADARYGIIQQPHVQGLRMTQGTIEKTMMTKDVVIATLKAAESVLKAKGVAHAALFGSVARGEQGPDSDIDIMVEIAPESRMGLWEYVGVVTSLEDMFPVKVDVANRETLKPHVRPSAERDAIYAF
jgi:predicted nucleotidyltransferase